MIKAILNLFLKGMKIGVNESAKMVQIIKKAQVSHKPKYIKFISNILLKRNLKEIFFKIFS